MLRELIEEGKSFSQDPIMTYGKYPTWINESKKADFLRWEMTSLLFLQNEYKKHQFVTKFNKIIDEDHSNCLIKTLNSLIGILEALEKSQPKDVINTDADLIICDIIAHFHACANQLKQRHEDRDTLIIKDEYDVQDLLHALLKLHFSDVRPEEWTPSYAGNSNRMDFLLKDEKIAIEVKMASKKLKDKEIGNQLIVDIAKYKQHSDVKALYCFIYNPDGYVNNPAGLENDLNKQSTSAFKVKVFVRPN